MVNLVAVLLVFMIVASIIAIWTKNLLSSVIAVGAVGFGSSAVFLLLQAPDVAITQTVVEVLTLVVLIRATVGRDVRTVSGQRDLLGAAVAAGLVVVFLAFSVVAIANLPAFGDPVVGRVPDAAATTYLDRGLPDTGAANIVAAILIDFRGYDTLGEATVMFVSILGAVTLLRSRSRTLV